MLKANASKRSEKETFWLLRTYRYNILREKLAATNLTLGTHPKVIMSQVHKDIYTSIFTATETVTEIVKMPINNRMSK